MTKIKRVKIKPSNCKQFRTLFERGVEFEDLYDELRKPFLSPRDNGRSCRRQAGPLPASSSNLQWLVQKHMNAVTGGTGIPSQENR